MKKIIYITIAVLGIFACQKNEPDDLFDGKTPSERFEQSQNELRTQLTTPQQGWKLTYFTDNKKFGGFTFLMKFTPEGFVSMASDVNATATPTTSKYEIKWGQGTLLSFTTKNYIHELSDAMQGEQGKGLEGEFEFIYLGKEGNKLKFKTQRQATEQIVYFEPATAQDWNVIQNLSGSVDALEGDILRHFFRVTKDGVTKDYSISLSNRYLTLNLSSDPSQTLKTAIVPTQAGFTFDPPLVIEGKTFTQITWDNNASPARYITTVDGVTAEIRFELRPSQEHISNDYQSVPASVNRFLFLSETLLSTPFTTEGFRDNVMKIESSKWFPSLLISFKSSTKCEVEVRYQFPNQQFQSRLIFVHNYEIKDKRIYIKDRTSIDGTNLDLWQATENEAILRKALTALNSIAYLGSEGLYIKKVPNKFRYTDDVYVIQSHRLPNIYFPTYGYFQRD